MNYLIDPEMDVWTQIIVSLKWSIKVRYYDEKNQYGLITK